MSVFFENGAKVEFAANPRFGRILAPFRIRPHTGVLVAAIVALAIAALEPRAILALVLVA